MRMRLTLPGLPALRAHLHQRMIALRGISSLLITKHFSENKMETDFISAACGYDGCRYSSRDG